MFQRGDGRGADAEFPETERHEALRGARVGSQFAAHPGFDTRPVRGVEHHADAALHGRVECVAKVGYAGFPRSAAITYCVRSLVPMLKNRARAASSSAMNTAAGVSIITPSAMSRS